MNKPRSGVKPVYRLTLKKDALDAIVAAPKKPFRFVPLAVRDGKYDLGITFSMADQLMTAAKTGENLSDTVLRILSTAKA